jgi:hypothetical protein
MKKEKHGRIIDSLARLKVLKNMMKIVLSQILFSENKKSRG